MLNFYRIRLYTVHSTIKMKKLMLLFLGLFFTVMMQAITVVSTAGGLAAAITAARGDPTTVTDLTVTATIR